MADGKDDTNSGASGPGGPDEQSLSRDPKEHSERELESIVPSSMGSLSVSRIDSSIESPDERENLRELQQSEAPARLGEFEVVRRLGMGGMAEVFLAKKRGAEDTYKLLVLKRILPEHVTSRRFQVMFAEEAQLATRLNHPNIVQVYDFQDYGDEGQLLSMEYVDGPNLKQLARAVQKKGSRLQPELVAYIISEVAKGLHYAHERKDESGTPLDIVHRDVSPQNLLLSYDGTVKVADFGIASANLFRDDTGVLKGKTAYMSPEQAAGQPLNRQTDIYSLGVVLHGLLTGKKLHGDLEGDELLAAVKAGQVEPPSSQVVGLPPELDEMTLKALSVDPQERFQSAREFSVALQRFLLERGQLIDAHELGNIIVKFCGEKLPDDPPIPEQEDNSAPDSEDGTPVQPLLARRDAGREVRHVAIVSLELLGREQLLENLGKERAQAALERLVATLNAIAFKRAMRLSWEDDSEGLPFRAHGIAGLLANPTGAAKDAVWFAVDLHEGIEAARVELDATLGARVGIVRSLATGQRNTIGHLVGHELSEHSLYLADTLRARSRQDSSLVAGGLYRLVRREFLWGDAPNLELKPDTDSDLPSRLRVYELIRGLTRDEKRKDLALAPNELVGRDAELADLHAAYYHALGAGRGSPQATARLISGELGIGKTALTDAFMTELPPDARVLRAECSQARQEVPYAVVGDWLRELTGASIEHDLDSGLHLVKSALGFPPEPQFEEVVLRVAELCTGRLGSAFDEAEAAHQRSLILAGLSQIVHRAGHENPLVVVVDALQWCDRVSLEILSQLLTLPDELPIVFLLVARPSPRLAEHLEGVLRLDLGGISIESQARLLQVRLGVGPGVETVCADVFPRAGGNPFFLLEMVDALLERGVLEIREEAEGKQFLERIDVAGSVVALPTTLEQLLADRLTELGELELGLLSWLAVAGGPLSTDDLRTLFGAGSDEVILQLEERGLIEVRDHNVDVHHPLTLDVAYRSLEKEDRRRLHRGLGELLAEKGTFRGMRAAVVARHLAKGGNSDQAAELYLEAAGKARSSYQMEIAHRSFQKVVKILPSGDPRLLEAHEALEAIARNEGRWKERKQHLVALRKLAVSTGIGYWVATTLLRSARYQKDGGHLARAAHLASRCEEAAREVSSEVLALQACGILAEALRDLGDMQGALAAVDRALARAEEPDITERLRAEILRAKGTLLRRVGRVGEALDVYAEAIVVFQSVGARRMEARARNSLSFALYMLGEFEDAFELAQEANQIESSIGGHFQIARTLANMGLCMAGVGQFEKSLSLLQQARDAHERYGERDARADTLLATAGVLIEVNELEAARSLVGDAAALIHITESRYDAVHERLLRALIARADGAHELAAQESAAARQAAENQAYASFHFYAMAIEAISRVQVDETHTGILLATTALGAVETLQGSEYALQTRALCLDALRQADSPQAEQLGKQARAFCMSYANKFRDPQLRKSFLGRAPVLTLLDSPEEEGALISPVIMPESFLLDKDYL